jgi:hypothetical protein
MPAAPPSPSVAGRDVIGKQQAAEWVEKDLERMGRERLLSPEKTLQKVARYEATSAASSTRRCTS